MKTNSKQHPIFAYLIDQLPTAQDIANEYGQKVEDTVQARIKFVVDTFTAEYCYPENLKRYGNRTRVLEEWLKGLPSSFSVDFENHKILELAKLWENIPQNATERQEQKTLDNWFNFAAVKFAQLCKFNKVEF